MLYNFQIVLSKKTTHNRLNVYFEPKDRASTNFIKNELLPLFRNASDIVEHLSLKLVPFGRAKCDTDNEEYGCVCTQGPSECDLMRLMSCLLHDYRYHEDALEIIDCIQERASLDDASNNCIQKLPNRDADW